MLRREIEAVPAERGHLDTTLVEEEWARISPSGIGDPAPIANGIVYLASDEAPYVTGTDLVIDGGQITR